MARAETLGIVGAGCMGRSLGRLLAPGFELLIASRSSAREAAAFAGCGARAETLEALAGSCACVIVAVPDKAVPAVSRQLAASRPPVVLQTCGALGPADLAPLPDLGASCATFHPLQTIPDPDAGVRLLPGSAFGVCGDGPAEAWCRRLARALDGTVLHVPEERLPLYHAAAVLASNCAVGLVDAASGLLEVAGADRSASLRALRPLLEASLKNALTMKPEKALTGPLVRGDVDTVRRHLRALQELPGPHHDLYRAFGRQLLLLAARRGLAAEDEGELRELLDAGD